MSNEEPFTAPAKEEDSKIELKDGGIAMNLKAFVPTLVGFMLLFITLEAFTIYEQRQGIILRDEIIELQDAKIQRQKELIETQGGLLNRCDEVIQTNTALLNEQQHLLDECAAVLKSSP